MRNSRTEAILLLLVVAFSAPHSSHAEQTPPPMRLSDNCLIFAPMTFDPTFRYDVGSSGITEYTPSWLYTNWSSGNIGSYLAMRQRPIMIQNYNGYNSNATFETFANELGSRKYGVVYWTGHGGDGWVTVEGYNWTEEGRLL